MRFVKYTSKSNDEVFRVYKDRKGWTVREFKPSTFLDPSYRQPLRVVARPDHGKAARAKYWSLASEEVRRSRRGRLFRLVRLGEPVEVRALYFDDSTREWVEVIDDHNLREIRRAPAGELDTRTRVYRCPWMEYALFDVVSGRNKPAFVYARD